MKTEAKYMAFGTLLTKLRQTAGIVQQSDLAKLLTTTQQTVSRWELGFSRPRDKQMSLLASVLDADLNELLFAAGYKQNNVVSTYDQPFPIDALSPDSFERFCFSLLSYLYPSAKVHRVGGQGHIQEGLDVEVIFPNKTYHTFQCKRVKEFGAQKVHLAVNKHTRAADQKVIFLARVASPQAREAIRQYSEWDIWDKEDISLQIRKLPKIDQLKLVDTFFHGQRLALLGEIEPGPWQTSDIFFAPFMGEYTAFSHRWSLIGRAEKIRELVEGLENNRKRAIFLVGTGGAGKTRVLKEAIAIYESARKGGAVYFLSPSEKVTNKSLEDLGNQEKVLVVDDAHDRDDLQLLFQYAAMDTKKTKLLLSFRRYGLDHIKSQASTFALSGDGITEVGLEPLTLEQATELAVQVLSACDGPEQTAKDIARLTLDCTLFTVIGSQVVAREKKYYELAKNEDVFRATLLGRFRDIIAGEIGSKTDAEPIRKLLKVLALLQPFYPGDEAIVRAVERVEEVKSHDVNRLTARLINSGVLFKRGGKYRLSPDLLADYIIEEACIGPNGASTGYAEQVFDVAADAHISNLLLNLGKLDWRRSDGNPSNSKLLDGVWGKLKPSSEYSDAHINAVTTVAYYQPKRALEFAEKLIREGSYLRDLPNLIKYAAYNLEFLPHACECLWEMGKDDNRALNQNPGHAIRILAELCAVEANKPIEYNEVIVDFCLSLLNKADSWTHTYTPFNVLESILATEGSTTESHGISFSFGRFSINYDFVSKLRSRVIDASIQLLPHQNIKIAVQAARFLQNAIQYSMTGEGRDLWTKDFVRTLKLIKKATQSYPLDPLVLIEIARSVSWHAHYAKDKTTPIAKSIIASLPVSLEFRTFLTVIDGFGHLLEKENFRRNDTEWNRHLETLTKDLLTTYPGGEQLRSFIEQILLHIEANFGAGNSSPYVLYGQLIHSSQHFAQATVENALVSPASKTMQFVGIALSKLFNEDHGTALKIASRLLDADSRDLQALVGRAFCGFDTEKILYGEEDIKLLRKLLTTNDEWIVISTVNAIRNIAKQDQRLALNLLKCVDVGMSAKVADDVLIFFQKDEVIPFQSLNEEDIDHFFNKLIQLPKLDGHWIETFLANTSKYHANRTAIFFMKRVEHAADIQSWKYRPCNYGPYRHVSLCFRESTEFDSLLRQVPYWMRSRKDDDYFFHEGASKLFEVMFQPFGSEVIRFFDEWLRSPTETDIRTITRILREASNDFVFKYRVFVIRFLEKAKLYDNECYENAVSALYASAATGMRSGTPGEPFPQDLNLKNNAEDALKEIPRFSPAYRLYEYLKKRAEQDIERSISERELFEE